MKYRLDSRRLPLLWRTVFLLTVFVIISQVIIYAWVQRSVSGHFEQMDSEIITHAAFNLRKSINDVDAQTKSSAASKSQSLTSANHLHPSRLDYDLKTVIANKSGALLSSDPTSFINDLPSDFSLPQLWQVYRDQQFTIEIKGRNYRAIIIENQEVLALIALPIDVHHHYLMHFNRQLSMILFAITLLLVSVAALSVYWGFAPLATIVQKMKRINPERLDERITVSDMPLELRPLAKSYNSMMVKLDSNFESLSRFSDNIAHELRTPIATLSTQTQVMLSKPRDGNEYIEQLHHQHDTLEQLSAMINNMLLLAKTQKGLSDSQVSNVDTEGLITKLIDYYEMLAEDREITFVKSGVFATVLGDEGLLQRLFANLLSNAIYYAASASTITISATIITSDMTLENSKEDPLSSKQSLLKIALTNRLDKPLNQSAADKLFERFYRHDKTSSQHSGTGLGLSIVRAIANAHKGKVNIAIKDEYHFEVTVELLMAKY
ncbi:ATP-binding protein [Psychrobacter sp. Ps6]|uniref:ATP-binding protein n=1 Tax=Psychrobacter sp. Ps6 TaxID=2790960 RepID=UPI001EDFA2E2|nr:ATP-binding protein [Psychrobacter sp. Ps6]MCG3878445.1 GHKL domain-containing protein [Psychrobacter sp. Ps6]